jgi:hypothetical protein
MNLINPQEAEAKVAARYRVVLILWIAMLASISALLIVALVTPGSGTPNQTLSFLLLGFGLIVVIVSLVLRLKLIKQAIEKQQLQSLLSAYIVGFALCESAALFGLMDHFTTGSGYYRWAFLVAATGMLLHHPKKDHVRAVSFEQF